MKLTRREFAAGIAAGVVAPHIISSAKAQGATIKIGMCAPVTGPAAESGGYAIKGAKLALEAVNKAGGILGKQAELIIEDDQTTNPGIVLAFSKLAAQNDIVAFLGSIRSTQVHAMAPDVVKLGKPVMGLSVADQGFVLETGRIVLGGKPDELWGNEAIRAAYLGGHGKVPA